MKMRDIWEQICATIDVDQATLITIDSDGGRVYLRWEDFVARFGGLPGQIDYNGYYTRIEGQIAYRSEDCNFRKDDAAVLVTIPSPVAEGVA